MYFHNYCYKVLAKLPPQNHLTHCGNIQQPQFLQDDWLINSKYTAICSCTISKSLSSHFRGLSASVMDLYSILYTGSVVICSIQWKTWVLIKKNFLIILWKLPSSLAYCTGLFYTVSNFKLIKNENNINPKKFYYCKKCFQKRVELESEMFLMTTSITRPPRDRSVHDLSVYQPICAPRSTHPWIVWNIKLKEVFVKIQRGTRSTSIKYKYTSVSIIMLKDD